MAFSFWLTPLLAAIGAVTVETPEIEEFQAQGIDIVQDIDGLRISMPRAAWQDPKREALQDRDFMAVLPLDFHDGDIEAEVKGDLAPGAPSYARGFVGFAFRIGGGQFETIYLRPTNGQSEDRTRRTHAVQYAAFPGWRFDRLRRETPGLYEAAADIAPGRWVHMRIEVRGTTARLFLDHRDAPTMVVNDLKLGSQQHGGIGLWVESATIAHFRELTISRR